LQRGFATSAEAVTLAKDSNQALGIGEFAIDFMNGKGTPDEEVSASATHWSACPPSDDESTASIAHCLIRHECRR